MYRLISAACIGFVGSAAVFIGLDLLGQRRHPSPSKGLDLGKTEDLGTVAVVGAIGAAGAALAHGVDRLVAA